MHNWLVLFLATKTSGFDFFLQFRTHKVIYRRYAGLFFSLCVDITDNELAYLECIHLFVEILDHFFSNVCELDLVFNFHKVCWFLFISSHLETYMLFASLLFCIFFLSVDSCEFFFWFSLITYLKWLLQWGMGWIRSSYSLLYLK